MPGTYAEIPANPPEIGIEEELGNFIPSNLFFLNESGDSVAIKALVTRPTILSLVYYKCPGICKALLSGVAEVLDEVDAKPGEDYDVITVSFDETDTPEDSRKTKQTYLHAMARQFPKASWTFLTGDSTTIRTLTDAVGYYFKREEEDFVHSTALIILSPESKIVRYLYGTTYLAFDLKMALVEASEGRIGSTITKVLRFCYSYDPEGKRYAINVTRIAGMGLLVVVLAFILYLTAAGRRRKRKANA
ncbi:MAG: SCO family protein [Candidatus Latescibacteria bacterium]|nr:SCO family protein [Candidatus Latescibacterota bacterium]NIM22159.1 SCO family protein [Candidatus Latescibacterota bacterium]NIM64709.1 SCO family protein [Candidatus Latescibacterota bacterium]NIO01219.1 SCO family protein [Candidatus Latescibacterota bacterium]NIO27604.1 SCO family protein [Candidatus Latescibacterota bacterium]